MVLPLAALDLHLHSDHSDGVHPPDHVAQLAANHGASLIALTDHDTFSGVGLARQAALQLNLTVIAGVEIGVQHPSLGELHVLGYFPATAPLDDLDQQLLTYRDERRARARKTLDRLAELGMELSMEAVERIAGDASLGRPHIARAMVEAGHVESVREAFARFLRNDGPAYIPRSLLSLADSVDLIHSADGFASLAHPTRYDQPAEASVAFAEVGGDGVEIYYRADPPAVVVDGERSAAALGLIPTVGSDFHGLDPHEMQPASVKLPTTAADRLFHILKDFAP